MVLDYKASRIKDGTIVFKLKTPAQLNAVNFDIFRGPRSFGWKTVMVYGIDGENKILLGTKDFNHPYALPAGEKNREKLTVAISGDSKFDTVEVNISITGSYLGLLEVSFDLSYLGPVSFLFSFLNSPQGTPLGRLQLLMA